VGVCVWFLSVWIEIGIKIKIKIKILVSCFGGGHCFFCTR